MEYKRNRAKSGLTKSAGKFQIDRMEPLEAEKCTGADLQEKRLERAEVLASWKQGEPYQAFTLGVGEC